MMPLILFPGRRIPDAKGLRGDGFGTCRAYSEAIERAGALTLQVAPTASVAAHAMDLMERADGLLLQGGGDVDPDRYGKDRSCAHIYGVDESHDDLEMSLVRAAFELNRPILGICRGMQVLNVALGGTLVGDLGQRIPDRHAHWDTYHPVQVVGGSRLAFASGTTPKRCHSYHHQALDTVAATLEIVASSPDGVIEAVEHRSCRWVVGVQWHPEDDADTEPTQQAIFDHFVAAARGYEMT